MWVTGSFRLLACRLARWQALLIAGCEIRDGN